MYVTGYIVVCSEEHMLKFFKVTTTSKHNITQLSLVAAVLVMSAGCEGVVIYCESGRW